MYAMCSLYTFVKKKQLKYTTISVLEIVRTTIRERWMETERYKTVQNGTALRMTAFWAGMEPG